jgi:hypothetical protein
MAAVKQALSERKKIDEFIKLQANQQANTTTPDDNAKEKPQQQKMQQKS